MTIAELFVRSFDEFRLILKTFASFTNYSDDLTKYIYIYIYYLWLLQAEQRQKEFVPKRRVWELKDAEVQERFRAILQEKVISTHGGDVESIW